MLIGGEWTLAASGGVLAVTDPSSGTVIARVPLGGAEEATRAVDAALGAQPGWASRPAQERCARVAALGALMRREEAALAETLTREQGKPLHEAAGEIRYAASFLEWAAGEGVRLMGEILPASREGQRMMTLRQPVGVAAAITPWNFPAAMITRKLGPALASGCAMVVKPSELTPLSALEIARLSIEAGIPEGVLNVVTGDALRISGVFFDHPGVRKVSFTGSTAVGKTLIRRSADRVVNLSLELGGHAPLIVFDDADIEHAVEQTIAAKFRNAGQTCIAPNRVYVQRGVYEAYRDALVARVGSMRAGSGLEPGTEIGPLINEAGVEKVERHVRDAASRGARVCCGGERLTPRPGLADLFYAPTVLDGCDESMLLFQEETFGPVVPLAVFDTEDEALARANGTTAGLAAYFFTRDTARTVRVAERLEFGVVGANDGAPSAAQAPFGGYKESGLGREGGSAVMNEYTEQKYISLGLGGA